MPYFKTMTREILLVVTSKDTQTSSNGSSVQMTFQPALTMGAQSTLKLIGANIWYAMPNIAAPSNVLVYSYVKQLMTAGGLVTSNHTDTITFDPGLYGLSSLNSTIGRHLSNHSDLSRYDITLSGDESTGKVALHLKTTTRDHVLTTGEYNITQIGVDFPESTLLSTYLGYTNTNGLVTGATEYEYIGANAASLNSLKSILVNCQQCNGSVLNGVSTGILANIPISVAVGSQIQYQPLYAPKISAPQMSNASVTEMTISLTDQDLKPLNMGGENWEVILVAESE